MMVGEGEPPTLKDNGRKKKDNSLICKRIDLFIKKWYNIHTE